MARIVGTPKAATGLSEAREAAGAIAEPRKARPAVRQGTPWWKDGSVANDANGEPKAKTSHSLNPVPGIIYDPEYKGEYDNEKLNDGLGISSWPATLMELMGYLPPKDYDKSLINLK